MKQAYSFNNTNLKDIEQSEEPHIQNMKMPALFNSLLNSFRQKWSYIICFVLLSSFSASAVNNLIVL